MNTWEQFLDGVLAGEPATVEAFARSAIGEVPPAEMSVRYPTGGPSVWGEAMWAEMTRIRNGEAA